jgi:hypothetical protein
MKTLLFVLSAVLAAKTAVAGPLAPDAQARIDARIAEIATWAADPVIVNAVRAQNAALPAAVGALTQDKWNDLHAVDPLVRAFVQNPVGEFLKTKKSQGITEAFVSDAAGSKVGFLAKPSSWCHLGKPKHDLPMSGKTWQGPIEVDESAGLRQLQVSVPVLDDGKPIGSLVVGLNASVLLQ